MDRGCRHRVSAGKAGATSYVTPVCTHVAEDDDVWTPDDRVGDNSFVSFASLSIDLRSIEPIDIDRQKAKDRRHESKDSQSLE